MELFQLKNACSRWDKSSDEFKEIVAATTSLGLYQRELAAEFEVAESTVSRWARGIARPHPRMQKLIVEAIEKRVQMALSAQNRGGARSQLPLAARSR